MSTTVETPDLTIEEYHALPSWSSSQVKLLPEEPEKFYRRHIEKHPAFQFKPTASTKLGTAVHEIILDGMSVKVIPDDVLSASGAKAGKAWKEFRREWEGTHILCKPADPILHMVASIRIEPAAAEWLAAEGPTEVSLTYDDDVTGLPLRSRPDKLSAVTHGGAVINELKTTKVNPYVERDIIREMIALGYFRQAAWQWDAVDLAAPGEKIPGIGFVNAFQFIVVQNVPPYVCHVVRVRPEDIDLGRRQNRRAIDDLHRRLDANDWKPETYGMVTYVELPDWYHKQEEANYG